MASQNPIMVMENSLSFIASAAKRKSRGQSHPSRTLTIPDGKCPTMLHLVLQHGLRQNPSRPAELARVVKKKKGDRVLDDTKSEILLSWTNQEESIYDGVEGRRADGQGGMLHYRMFRDSADHAFGLFSG